MAATPPRIIIAGAGIGGLATAAALKAEGCDVSVLEQVDVLEKARVGIGMVLWPNGMRALERLGVADRVLEKANRLEALEFYSASGQRLMRYALDRMVNHGGAPTVAFVRADLHLYLSELVADGTIKLDSKCESFSQDAEAVTAHAAGGREERGDVLVGADGVHSELRRQAFGLGLPEFPPYRYTVWHSVIPFPDREKIRPGVFYLIFGRGLRFNAFRVEGKGDRVYWATLAYVEEEFQEEGSVKGFLVDRFSDFMSPVERLIEQTDESAIGRMRIYGEQPIDRWGEGRFTLLGDAAHPLTTVLGQGAGQALEDAMVISQCLGRGDDLVASLREYERRRIQRTGQIIKLIGRLSSAASQETPMHTWVRDQILIRRLFKLGFARRFEGVIAGAKEEY
jgi:2-polyprenyl-6-methoxyphenol hydroxylase-like FAD-dependent oxidoreductase